jgi:hypothetical protein
MFEMHAVKSIFKLMREREREREIEGSRERV